ncbi:50S ribosomal protein L4 [Patescibacteria group bacterium]|nr:50S ribosomal protein L4 [Patescibacteria group bacterium]
MKVKVYNQKKEEVGEIELLKEIFEIKLNTDLVHQVVLAQTANQRQGSAKVKTRAEARGGGRKPWRQKGTGRARVGSIRSPIWRGGGVTFGPTTEKVFKKRIPKKMRRKALFMVLSVKAKENLLLVLDKLEIGKPKTKVMAEVLNKLFLKKGSGLIVLSKMNKSVILSVKNIPKTGTIQAKDLNVLDLLSYKYLVMTKEAIKIIKDTFLK